jgi:hypothetical protein
MLGAAHERGFMRIELAASGAPAKARRGPLLPLPTAAPLGFLGRVLILFVGHCPDARDFILYSMAASTRSCSSSKSLRCLSQRKTRPSHFVPVLNNVRCASDSDHSRYESELTLWAKSGRWSHLFDHLVGELLELPRHF